MVESVTKCHEIYSTFLLPHFFKENEEKGQYISRPFMNDQCN